MLVVCKTNADCTIVRVELASISAQFPIHLLLMTPSEEAEVKFIQAESAVEITPGEAIPATKKATITMIKRKSDPMEGKGGDSPSQLIDARIKELADWRGEMLARVRILIKQADPEVVEEWKWRGVPVWSHAGIICTGETYAA